MGFCLINNIAVAAANLAERGERVLVLDWDAHHGNGTEAIFWDDPRVLYVSTHQYGSFYPGTGALDDVGGPGARGTTLNLPFPSGTTGDVYLRALDEVVGAGRGGVRPDLGAGVGRLRRPPGRPADRAAPVGRRLRRHRPAGGRLRPRRRAGWCCSWRAATTSTP